MSALPAPTGLRGRRYSLVDTAFSGRIPLSLSANALTAAEQTRGSLAGAVMHTNHGAQYIPMREARDDVEQLNAHDAASTGP